MPAATKVMEKGVSLLANVLWYLLAPVLPAEPEQELHAVLVRRPDDEDEGQVPARRSASRARPTLSVRPARARRGSAIVDGTLSLDTLRREKVGEIKARIVQRGNEIWMEKDCPIHGHFEDILSIDAEFYKKTEAMFMGGDLPITPDGLHDHGSSTAPLRPRHDPHGGPHQPLQHDVRPLLHRRQPGGVRARARLAGDQADPRQRDGRPPAPPDVGPVLGRRADAVAALPGRRPLREGGRLQQRAGGHQRRRVREEPGILPAGGRGRPALRLPAVRRRRQRGQLAPPHLEPVRREAARHREPARGRRGHRSGVDDHQRRQQRAGRPDRQVRDRQPEEDLVHLVPAGVLHRPRRGGDRGAPPRAALHDLPPRPRHQAPGGSRASRRATGSRSR